MRNPSRREQTRETGRHLEVELRLLSDQKDADSRRESMRLQAQDSSRDLIYRRNQENKHFDYQYIYSLEFNSL